MDTYSVEFRIEGALLVPQDVTMMLGLEPCRIVGSDIGNHDGKHQIPLWSYDGTSPTSSFSHEWNSLEEGLMHLLKIFLPKKKLIRSKFSKFDIYWWCGHFQQSFDGVISFSPELLKKLADFEAPLFLSNYFSEA